MFLQPHDLGCSPACFGLTFYACVCVVMVLCFVIAIKLIGDYDGD